MSQFELYFQLGKEHILDYKNDYYHIFFLIALLSVYLMRDWKKILILLTAFTTGHAISLALSSLSIDQPILEFLIPLIIFITAISNIFRGTDLSDRTTYVNYGYALLFGVVHGLWFSNYLKSILGKEKGIVTPLFAMNLGLELGQLIIITIFLIVSFILVDLFTVDRRDWRIVLSSAIAGMALLLIKDKIFW